MPGINFLYEEYKKDPQRIEKLLSQKLEISEKLDGSRFLVQKEEGNKLLFYKRKDVPISKIDRTLSKYYEKGILHFENLSEEKSSQMPDGWRFGMEYFPNLHPVTISYDVLPLNNLVLTDIQVKDPRDRTLEVITDKETLNKWADILEVEKPPIVFEGNLSDSQKRRILDFLNTPYSDLIKRFKTESFTSFILTLLNPELKKSFLHNDLSKDIDGLIFKFDGKETFRVSNPEITLKKQEKKEEKPSDVYNLTLVFLQEFLTALDFKRIKLKEKGFEDRYIEFICQVYNKFLQTSVYKNNFAEGVDFDLPHFLTKIEADDKFKFVKDAETMNHLKVSNTNRELFKILLASMRSYKKKPSGFFTKDLIANHNELVDKIANYISNGIQESVFYSFEEFRSVYLTESERWQEEFGKEKLDELEQVSFIENPNFPTYDQATKIDLNPPLSTVKLSTDVLRKCYSGEVPVDKKKRSSVCLMKGKFSPFHNGHISAIKDAAEVSGSKVFLVILNKRIPSENTLPENLRKSIIEECIKDLPVEGYVFSNGRSFREICKDLPDNLKVVSYAGSTDECEDVQIQMGEDFPVFPLTKHISSSAVMQKIKDEDFETYKKLVPSNIHNYFYKIKNEVS